MFGLFSASPSSPEPEPEQGTFEIPIIDFENEGLSGELMVDSEEEADSVGERALAEMKGILLGRRNTWYEMQGGGNCLMCQVNLSAGSELPYQIERQLLTGGPFLNSGCYVYRARFTLDCPARELFKALNGPFGMKMLFPDMVETVFDKAPLMSWSSRGLFNRAAAMGASTTGDDNNLKLYCTRIPMGGMVTERQCLMLVAADPFGRTVVAKSVLNPHLPGGSHYSDEKQTSTHVERAVIFSGFQVDEALLGGAIVTVVHWNDLCGQLLAVTSNEKVKNRMISANGALNALVAAIKQASAEHPVEKLRRKVSDSLKSRSPGSSRRSPSFGRGGSPRNVSSIDDRARAKEPL